MPMLAPRMPPFSPASRCNSGCRLTFCARHCCAIPKVARARRSDTRSICSQTKRFSHDEGRWTNAELDAEVIALDAKRDGVSLQDFWAFMPTHSYIYAPTHQMWPAASVNARVPQPAKNVSASAWLDQHRPVEQMTWMPGSPMLINNKLIAEGGLIERNGVTCFNLYRPPIIEKARDLG